jgi:hypothetical protein
MAGLLLLDDAKEARSREFNDWVDQFEAERRRRLNPPAAPAAGAAPPQIPNNAFLNWADELDRKSEASLAQAQVAPPAAAPAAPAAPPQIPNNAFLNWANDLDRQSEANLGQTTTAITPPAAPVTEPIAGPAAAPMPQAAATFTDISQFGDSQLSSDEAYAACGPAAAVRFAQHYGRNPTLREALDLAKDVGWTAQRGMAGLDSEKALMDRLDVPTKVIRGAAWDQFAAEAQTGNPVTISTPGHYFFADSYNPETGQFHVGRSGTDLRGGSEWMTREQMERLMGTAQGALFADNPTVAAPSTATGQTAATAVPATATRTTADLSGGGPAGNLGDRALRILGEAADAARAFGQDAIKAVQSVLITEGGLNNARGDQGASAGPLQFFGTATRAGQLNNLANFLGTTLEGARNWVEQNPGEAVRWALGTPDNPGYLGRALLDGQRRGLQGADLATHVQRTGQVSVSPERAGQNYNALFGGGGPALGGEPVRTEFEGQVAPTREVTAPVVTADTTPLAPRRPGGEDLLDFASDRWRNFRSPITSEDVGRRFGEVGEDLGRRVSRFVTGDTTLPTTPQPMPSDLLTRPTIRTDEAAQPPPGMPPAREGPAVLPSLGEARDRVLAGDTQGALQSLDEARQALATSPVGQAVSGFTAPGGPLGPLQLSAEQQAEVERRRVEREGAPTTMVPIPDVVRNILFGPAFGTPGPVGQTAAELRQGLERDIAAANPLREIPVVGPVTTLAAQEALKPENYLLFGPVGRVAREAASIIGAGVGREIADWAIQGGMYSALSAASRPNATAEDVGRAFAEGALGGGALRAGAAGIAAAAPQVLRAGRAILDSPEVRQFLRTRERGEAEAGFAMGIPRPPRPEPDVVEIPGPSGEVVRRAQQTPPEVGIPSSRPPTAEQQATAEATAAAIQNGPPTKLTRDEQVQILDFVAGLRREQLARAAEVPQPQSITWANRLVQYLSSNLLFTPGNLSMNMISQGEEAVRAPLLRALAGERDAATLGAEAYFRATADSLEAMENVLRTGLPRVFDPEQVPSKISRLAPGVRTSAGIDEAFRVPASARGMAEEAVHQVLSQPDLPVDQILARGKAAIEEAGQRAAARAVFAEGPSTGAASAFARSKNELLQSSNPLKQLLGVALHVVTPFARVPERIWTLGLLRSPILNELAGAVRVARARDAGDMRALRMAAAETVLDTTINAAIAGYAATGNITAANDPEHPWSIRTPFGWMDYRRLGPMATRMGLIASFFEANEEQANQLNGNVLVETLNKGSELLANEWYTFGLLKLARGMLGGQGGDAITEFAVGKTDMLVPVGGLANYIEKSTDPIMRDPARNLPAALWERPASRMPIVAQLIPERVSTTTGEPLRRPEQGFIETLLDLTSEPSDPIKAELARLRRKGYSLRPPDPSVTEVTVAGSEIPLNDAERRIYLAGRGRFLAKEGTAFMKSKDYVQGKEDERAADNRRAAGWANLVRNSDGAGKEALRRALGDAEWNQRIAAGHRETGRLTPLPTPTPSRRP